MSKMESTTLKEIAISFLQLVASGKIREAYDRFVGENFLHHNPYFKGDAESLIVAMEENAKISPYKTLQVKLAVQEDDRVVLYSHIKQHQGDLGAAVVHIFLFKEERIVEMWDVGQAIPEDSPNENGMF